MAESAKEAWERAHPHDGECYVCGFKTDDLQSYGHMRCEHDPKASEDSRRFWACLLCVRTFASNAYCYPTHYNDGNAMRAICHVGNVIIAEIQAQTEGGP